jgi:hypothetical protein
VASLGFKLEFTVRRAPLIECALSQLYWVGVEWSTIVFIEGRTKMKATTPKATTTPKHEQPPAATTTSPTAGADHDHQIAQAHLKGSGKINDVGKRTNTFHFRTFDHTDPILQDSELSAYGYCPDTRIDGLMAKWDLVIAIEHCCSCECHASSLRHDPLKYSGTANSFLQHMAAVVSIHRYRVRCGVIRLNIYKESRIGAFEIYVAFRDRTGKLTWKMLHSKLESKLWPSKKVVEKHFLDFLSTMRVPKISVENISDCFMAYTNEGVARYPVGYGPWEEVPMADPSWEYPLDPPERIAVSGKGTKIAMQTLPPPPSSIELCWAFDSTEVEPFRPVVGEHVRISGLKTPRLSVERFGLMGTFMNYRLDIPLDEQGEHTTVMVKYTDEIITIPLLRLSSDVDYQRHATYDDSTDFPEELLLLLLFCRSHRERLVKMNEHGVIMEEKDNPLTSTSTIAESSSGSSSVFWRLRYPEDTDSFGRVFVSRRSLFSQLRDIVCEMEQIVFPHLPETSSEGKTIYHPVSGHIIDLQQTYSEEILDWTFSQEVRSRLEEQARAQVATDGNNVVTAGELVDIKTLEDLAGVQFLSSLEHLAQCRADTPHYAMPLQLYLLRHCVLHALRQVITVNSLYQSKQQMYHLHGSSSTSSTEFVMWFIKLIRSVLYDLCYSLAELSGDAALNPVGKLHFVVQVFDSRKQGSLNYADIKSIVLTILPDFTVPEDSMFYLFSTIGW